LSSARPTVFLTGATGFIGRHILQALTARGESVRCLVRDPAGLGVSVDAQARGGKVEVVKGDLRDSTSFSHAIEGCRTVYHCAADYRLYARRPEDLYESNVEGTRNVLAAAAAGGVERVVYTSSVGALGLNADETPADERTPVALEDMVGHYKRSKFLAERVAEEWFRKGLQVVMVNPSTPVGEGDAKPTATGRMILDFLNGQVPAYVDTGLNLIDVRDVAAGHLLAAEKGRPGEKYILGHRNMSLLEIYRTLAAIADLPAPRIRLPHFVPMAYAAVDTMIARLRQREPRVALESVRLARYKMYFSAERAVRDLGLPQTPVEEALRRAVEWFRDNGYVR
jgi:dihydroflavonol-4-reductase